jgi:hypothetical protein
VTVPAPFTQYLLLDTVLAPLPLTPLAFVPFWNPPNSAESTMISTTNATSQIRQPMGRLNRRRRSVEARHLMTRPDPLAIRSYARNLATEAG